MRRNKLPGRRWYMGVIPYGEPVPSVWIAIGRGERASVLVDRQRYAAENAQSVRAVIVYHLAGVWCLDDTQDAGATVDDLQLFDLTWLNGPANLATLCEAHRIKVLNSHVQLDRMPR